MAFEVGDWVFGGVSDIVDYELNVFVIVVMLSLIFLGMWMGMLLLNLCRIVLLVVMLQRHSPAVNSAVITILIIIKVIISTATDINPLISIHQILLINLW